MSFGGSGTGKGSISTDSDVALSNVANGDTLQYDSSVAKWENAAGGSGTIIVPFDFQTNGNQYFTSPISLTLSSLSTINGSGNTQATISFAVNGSTKNLPITMAASDELTVLVSGMTGSNRCSFSLEGS